MPATADATMFQTLTPVQGEVSKPSSKEPPSPPPPTRRRPSQHGPLWTRNHPAFARTLLAARQDRAEALLDELSDLSQLACDTFRQILSDPATPAATRLKAAMEIVKTRPESKRPTERPSSKRTLTSTVTSKTSTLLTSPSTATRTTPFDRTPIAVAPHRPREESRFATPPAPAAAASSTNAAAATPSPKPAPPEQPKIFLRKTNPANPLPVHRMYCSPPATAAFKSPNKS